MYHDGGFPKNRCSLFSLLCMTNKWKQDWGYSTRAVVLQPWTCTGKEAQEEWQETGSRSLEFYYYQFYLFILLWRVECFLMEKYKNSSNKVIKIHPSPNTCTGKRLQYLEAVTPAVIDTWLSFLLFCGGYSPHHYHDIPVVTHATGTWQK